MQSLVVNRGAFTLVELVVAITISVMVLGGVFYLMSATINNSLEARSQSEFLKNFYAFTGVFDTGEISIVEDNAGEQSDVGIVTTPGIPGGILFGVIDTSTKSIIPPEDSGKYTQSVFAYRTISDTELTQIQNSTLSVYNLEFQNDKIFQDFYIKSLRLEEFNSGELMNLEIDLFIQYIPSFLGQDWSDLPQEFIYSYTLAF